MQHLRSPGARGESQRRKGGVCVRSKRSPPARPAMKSGWPRWGDPASSRSSRSARLRPLTRVHTGRRSRRRCSHAPTAGRINGWTSVRHAAPAEADWSDQRSIHRSPQSTSMGEKSLSNLPRDSSLTLSATNSSARKHVEPTRYRCLQTGTNFLARTRFRVTVVTGEPRGSRASTPRRQHLEYPPSYCT